MNHADSIGILAPAFLAGVLVLLTHIPLGMQVLQRGIVFIDLAIAQIAALGVIAAGVLMPEPANWMVQITATISALAGALLLAWMEKRWPEVQEAQIGAIFVLAATGGLLLLAGNPHGGEHLRDLLTGQILWVSFAQLIWPAILSVAILLLMVRHKGQLPPRLFYLAFALAITASVQLVGVYLVFASLILPALGTRQLQGKRRMLMAGLIGAAGYGLGLLISLWADLPAGALIVWMIALLGIAHWLLKPNRNLPNAGIPPPAPQESEKEPSMTHTSLISLRDLQFRWHPAQPCLDLAALEIAAGERVFLHGPSGSGKSTLLGVLGGIHLPQAGQLHCLGQDLSLLSARARDQFRVDHIGFVFQQFNLLPYLSVLDNVQLPCRFSKLRRQRAIALDGSERAAAYRLLAHLDLPESLFQRPAAALSTGQQQRVAVARALIGQPELVIADEPTSALDAARQDRFLDLLAAECSAAGSTLLFVSHDLRLAAHFDRVLALQDINRAALAEVN